MSAIENSSRPKRRRLDEPLRIDPQPSFERGRALEVNGEAKHLRVQMVNLTQARTTYDRNSVPCSS